MSAIMWQWDWQDFCKRVLTSMFHTTWDLITPENVAQALGAVAAALAMLISLTHIFRHWRHNRTKIRKSTVRLLFVVPIFALDCWACLMLEASDYDWAELLTCVREVYEAVALVSFMELVLTMLGGSKALARALERRAKEGVHDGDVHQMLPMRLLLRRYKAGAQLLQVTLLGIFQYVFVSLGYLVLITLIWIADRMHMVPSKLHLVLRILPNVMKAVSCGWALTCLLLFAVQVKELVPSCGLPLKFLSIKGIVFFTFWQGFAIWVMQKTGEFYVFQHWIASKAKHVGMDNKWWDDAEVKSGLNDFLLCFEVLFFSLLHLKAYPAREVETMPVEVQQRITLRESGGDSPYAGEIERIISAMDLRNITALHREISAFLPGPASPERPSAGAQPLLAADAPPAAAAV